MKRIIKSIICLGMCSTAMFAFGCTPDNNVTDNIKSETVHLRLSTPAVDGNFNPFFYTAQPDGDMISYTQISMLTTDENGDVVAGQNYPTAVLDYRETKYTTVTPGTGEVITQEGTTVGRTEYEFVIKNGIKFSDGESLSIVDVLFNLYVYLDTAYTGSSTIYSTDIQGLKAYRAQEKGLSDTSTADTDARFRGEAQDRIRKIINWSTGDISDTEFKNDAQAQADLEAVKTSFRSELELDWTNIESSWSETYSKSNRFTSAWEAFLYQEGLVWDQYTRNANNSLSKLKDENDRYYTTLDPWQAGACDKDGGTVTVGTTEHQYIIDSFKDLSESEQKEKAIELVYENKTDRSNIAEVLLYWNTASTILEDFTNEQRSIYIEAQKKAGNDVKSISGITTYTATGSELSSFKGAMNESYTADETYSVMKIVINGVDPKAIFNFAYPVAPLHYYSGVYTDKNGNTTDYVAEAKARYNQKDNECFGVAVGDPTFFKNVLQASSKNGIPVGAGPYMCADVNGNPTSNANSFKSTSMNFVRNTYFETVGEGISNTKIKYLRFNVLQDDQIMSALTTQSIDFGMPSATPTNMNAITNYSYLSEEHYTTGGYGYVGINPKAVPEYPVRQAIMKAMDTSMTVGYYGSLAEVLSRPLTKTSWVYDYFDKNDPINTEYESIAYYESVDEIRALVESAGYTLQNGVYTKTRIVSGMGNNTIGKTLKLSFTIAGDTEDHPAYAMFMEAKNTLNDIGFDINVKKDANALMNLATGNTEVWAAAWSSSIDPDPYQIYHKDSGATSVLNWNYRNILNNPTEWEYEYDIIQQLSDKIDEGRSMTERNLRAEVYGECLDLIMSLAVELPTYQRCDLCVYNNTVIDASTLVKKPSFNMGLFDRIWEIDYVK